MAEDSELIRMILEELKKDKYITDVIEIKLPKRRKTKVTEDIELRQARAEMERNGSNALRKDNFDILMNKAFGRPADVKKRRRILVVGPVTYINYKEFSKKMDSAFQKHGLSSPSELIISQPVGFGRLAERYACEQGHILTVMPILRERYGEYADMVWTQRALAYLEESEAPLIVSFCDGFSLEPDRMLLAGRERRLAVEPFEVGIVR